MPRSPYESSCCFCFLSSRHRLCKLRISFLLDVYSLLDDSCVILTCSSRACPILPPCFCLTWRFSLDPFLMPGCSGVCLLHESPQPPLSSNILPSLYSRSKFFIVVQRSSKMNAYFQAFEETLAVLAPRLHAHMSKASMRHDVYLTEW